MSDQDHADFGEAAAIEVPLDELSEVELIEERRELQAIIISLMQQLEQDEVSPRSDPTWRSRARAKLRHTLAERDLIRLELQRRNREARAASAVKKAAAKEAVRVALLTKQLEAKISGEQQKTERLKLHEEKRANREALFVMAAAKILTKEQREVIWAKARELYPDDPSWDDNARQELRAAIQAAYIAGEGGYATLANRFGVDKENVRMMCRSLRQNKQPPPDAAA